MYRFKSKNCLLKFMNEEFLNKGTKPLIKHVKKVGRGLHNLEKVG